MQRLPFDPSVCPRLSYHFQHQFSPLHLHRIRCLSSHYAPWSYPAQPTCGPYPLKLHRRHNGQRGNLQHPTLLPSCTPRKRYNVRPPAHRSLPSSISHRNSNRLPHHLDETPKMALSHRHYISVHRSSRAILHAEGTAKLGVPVFPRSFRDRSGVHVPSYVYGCSRGVGTERAGGCDEYVDSVEVVGDGVGGCVE